MEKQAKTNSLPFLHAYSLAKERYALDMREDDFIESGYKAWRLIGNIAKTVKTYYTKVSDDFIVELPDDCEFIRSVTRLDYLGAHGEFDSSGYKAKHLPATYIKSAIPEVNESIKTSPGESINYVVDGDVIRITSADMLNRDILVKYDAIDIDGDGLPLINDKEAEAIAAEVTRRNTIRGSFQGIKVQQHMLEFISGEADRLLAAAKIDEKINDDGVDKLLDIKTSWDRKVYGRRFDVYK